MAGSDLPYTRQEADRTAALYVGSSENMEAVEDRAVALTITSPPYWNAIDYDRHSNSPDAYYRTRSYSSGFDDYPAYLEWLSGIFNETFRKTKPGGFLAVVIGTVLYNGSHYPVPFDLTCRLVKDGWEFHQDIIWHKTTAGVKRAGVFIQRPYPGYFYPNIMTEYILVFRRPGDLIYRSMADDKTKSAVSINAVFTNDIANNIWHIAPVPPRTLDHPAPFPEEIPYRLVQLYSYANDLVLDPFLGSGQTTKVAWALGRSVVGYDIIPAYVEYAYSRLNQRLSVRRRQLVARFDKIRSDTPTGQGQGAKKTRHGSGRSESHPDEGGLFST